MDTERTVSPVPPAAPARPVPLPIRDAPVPPIRCALDQVVAAVARAGNPDDVARAVVARELLLSPSFRIQHMARLMGLESLRLDTTRRVPIR